MSALAAWGRLWQAGAADSFGATGKSPATQTPLAGLWLREFAALPAHARVLDIATGAGVLPRLLLHACKHATVECDAVDAAELPQAQLQQTHRPGQPQLRFHQRVFAESLPFVDSSFDLVTSQFGIEYARLPLALAQACRVLKPGGHLCLVMHHSDGRPAALAREELLHSQWLFQASDWPNAAREMLLPLSLIRSPVDQLRLQTDPHLIGIRQRYDQALATLQGRAAASAAPDLLHEIQAWAIQVFQTAAQHGQTEGLAAWQRLMALVADGAVRVQDLLDHVLDAAHIEGMRRQLVSDGFDVEVHEAQEQGHCMGWQVSARRSE